MPGDDRAGPSDRKGAAILASAITRSYARRAWIVGDRSRPIGDEIKVFGFGPMIGRIGSPEVRPKADDADSKKHEGGDDG